MKTSAYSCLGGHIQSFLKVIHQAFPRKANPQASQTGLKGLDLAGSVCVGVGVEKGMGWRMWWSAPGCGGSWECVQVGLKGLDLAGRPGAEKERGTIWGRVHLDVEVLGKVPRKAS